MSKLNDAYMRDLEAGRIPLYKRSRKKRKKKGHWFHRKIHPRPESGLWRWLRLKVWERDNWTCQYCGSTDRDNLQVDHIMPISRGGSNKLKNLVTACRPCNISKCANVLPQDKFLSLRAGVLSRWRAQAALKERATDLEGELEQGYRHSMGGDDERGL